MRIPSLALTAAALAVASAAAPTPTHAQSTATLAVQHDAPFLAGPGGRPLATVLAGATVTGGATRAGFTQVELEGFVSTTILAGKRDSFAITIKPGGGRLRASASTGAAVLANLRAGMGLVELSRDGEWVRVRRTGWVESRLLAASAPASTAGTTAAASADSAPAAATVPAAPPAQGAELVVGTTPGGPEVDRTVSDTLPIRTAPDGRAVATLLPRGRAEIVARDRDWVRVRVEGWVRERDLIPVDSGVQMLSAADLRADPEGTRGQTVRWQVQLLAFQTADRLRRDMAPDEPYLLARGPGRENALLYLALPPSLVQTARAIPALSQIVVTARVRTGRSDPVGVPILDVQSIVRH